MQKAARLIAIAGFIFANCALNRGAEVSIALMEQHLVSLYQKNKDAVVKVKVATKTTNESGEETVALTVLSGFFIDSEGTVLTNAVPTHEGPRIRVEKDRAQLLAVPIGSDPVTNIALLKLAKPPQNIQYIDLENAAIQTETGAMAFSITSPLEFAPTPRMGIIGGKESSFGEIAFPFTYTRIGIPSGPAEGGSPVFNSQGQFIGISVAALPETASSYIVPTRPLKRIIDQLRLNKAVEHQTIKAEFKDRGSPIDFSKSVFVESIEPNSSAEKSGLKNGDQIRSFQGIEIKDVHQLRDLLFFGEAGSFITLKVQRQDQEIEIPILLEKR